jgi:PTS system nitrogen regulatory IIA component
VDLFFVLSSLSEVMSLSALLSPQRISLDSTGQGFVNDAAVLEELSRQLCLGISCDARIVFQKLAEREKLQSTGIGDGVAIPHTAIDDVPSQRAALVICPHGVQFASIDRLPVTIFFGVIGPKNEASAHLKVLAKISRLLRNPETRRRLLESSAPEEAYALIEAHDRSLTES